MTVDRASARLTDALPAIPEILDDTGNGVISQAGVAGRQIIDSTTQGIVGTLQKRLAGAADANANRSEFISRVANSTGRLFSHVPNILDDYSNYTYHIRWSLTDDVIGSAITSAAEFRDNTTKVVIAESGVTAGFNITEFEIENICQPGSRVQAMLHTGIKMVVKEPFGLSLVDKIYSISRQMGVKNHLTNCTFIEIWFTGYKEDGTSATAEMKSNMYKLFRINVTKLNSETTSNGTEYRIEGIIDNAYANADHIAIIPQAAQIEGARTIGEFFDRLQTILNQQQLDLLYDGTQRVEYAFNVPRQMRTWEFSRSPTSSQRNNSISVVESPNIGNPTFTISRGMDISTVLYFVISMTTAGTQYVAGDNAQGASRTVQMGRNTASIAANGMANIIVIHSRSQLIGFDYITNDYIRKITYTFMEYPTARAMIDQQNVEATLQPAQQQNRRATLASSGRYIKSYDYIFTGRNIDILNLEIKVEWFWQATIPTQLGENNYSNFTVAPQQDQNGVAPNILNQYRIARANHVRAATELANATSRARNGRTAAERSQAEGQIESLTREVADRATEVRGFGDASRFRETWEDSGTGSRALQNITAGDALRTVPQAVSGTAARTAWSQIVDARRTQYLEDVNVLDVYSNPLPISFRPNSGPISQRTTVGGTGNTEQHGAQHSPSNLPRNRSLISAVLNDVMATPYFASVDLEIRGDPYWLGLGNVEENRRITMNQTVGAEYSANGAWFYNGETGFFLTFRTGEAPNEETGYVDFTKESIAFTGLYNVHTVKSLFRDGQFKQTLKAIRDPLTTNGPATPAADRGRPVADSASATLTPGNSTQPTTITSGANAVAIPPAIPPTP